MIKSLELVGTASNIVYLWKTSMQDWKTRLESGEEKSDTVRIEGGIF